MSSQGANSGESQRGNSAGQNGRDTRSPKKSPKKTSVPKETEVEGSDPALKGFYYDIGPDAAEGYTRTTRAIANEVVRKFKEYGGMARLAILSLDEPTFDLPADLPQNAPLGLQRRWENEVDEVDKKRFHWSQNNPKIFVYAWGQSTEPMKEKLQSQGAYEQIAADQDGLGLLRMIRAIAYNYNSNKYVGLAVVENTAKLYRCIQRPEESVQAFYERYNNTALVVHHGGGYVGGHPGIERVIAIEHGWNPDIAVGQQGAMTPAQRLQVRQEGDEAFLSMLLFNNADRGRFGELQTITGNDFARGTNNYPRTRVAAYELLNSYKPLVRKVTTRGNDGVSFHNSGHPGGNKEDESGTANVNNGRGSGCFKCGGNGHIARDCPTNDSDDGAGVSSNSGGGGKGSKSDQADSKEGKECGAATFFTTTMNGYTFHEGGPMPKTWVLLDNQSTLDVFSNGDLLENIREGLGSMTIHCNAGSTRTTMIGDLPGYGTVWYNPDGVANILSVSRVIDRGYQVRYDSQVENRFLVVTPDGDEVAFKQSEQGLFYFDLVAGGSIFVNTVAGNQSRYTKRQIARADLARSLQQTIGRPSTQDFIKILNDNLIPNCPVTANDVVIAEEIYGPDTGSLQGKTTRRKVGHVSARITEVPQSIYEKFQDVTVCADVMFINGIPFLVTISRDIKFGTVEKIERPSSKCIVEAVEQVRRIYAKRNFRVQTLLVDGQFESIRAKLAALSINLNVTSRDEHVPEAERRIRTIKERVRAVLPTLPFQHMPVRMLIELVYYANFWLNCFPASDGISSTLSPRSIIDGTRIDYNRHCKLQFGQYVHTHEQHDSTMAPRTIGAIALRPTGNDQGGYYFYSLQSGRRINRSSWTALPMPADVIDKVHTLARRDRVVKGKLTFSSSIEEDEIYYDDGSAQDASPDDDDDDDDDGPPMDPGVMPPPIFAAPPPPIPIAAPPHFTGDEDDGSEDEGPRDYEPPELHDDGRDDDDSGDDISNDGDGQDSATGQEEGVEDNGEEDGEDEGVEDESDSDSLVPVENVEDEMDRIYGPRGREGLRQRKPRNYDHLYPGSEYDMCQYAFSQYSMNAGLKRFGEKGTEAVLRELKQLHDRSVMEPKLARDMTREDKRKALSYLMFLKEKKNGVIKGRGCADGRKQREYISREESSSPTVAVESVFLTSVIDAREGRDVATVDVPGAFMQADMDDLVYMRLDGVMVDLLIEIDDKYEQFVTIEKGKRVIYVQLIKALYGTLKAAMLFWKKLTGVLESWGFTVNEYDRCVANKMINGKQCTIAWHVDDLKISHVESEVVSSVIADLNKEFGKETPLTETRGKIHDYLGMTLDFSKDGKVQVDMTRYVAEILAEVDDEITGGTAPTPAATYLFDVNEECDKLDQRRSEIFHHTVAKMLFLCKRARPDIQTAVAFLCTRVKAPDKDDFKKLARVLRYLRGTSDMVLTLESDGMNVVKWWADASFAVHADFKSHTGGAMSLGKGVVYGTSTRQKINTRSSTEAELVAANDVMGQLLWTQHFLKGQGYSSTQTRLYQDNQSAILLEKNGTASSSKRTRHLDIRYFFITDRVANRDLTIEYCPTEKMIADFFTKPLQGSLFQRLRDTIMNIDPATEHSEHPDQRSVLEISHEVSKNDSNNDWTVVTRQKGRRVNKKDTVEEANGIDSNAAKNVSQLA